MTVQGFLTVSALIFTLGLYCLMTRRNAIGVLLGVELVLNSENINLVTFSRYVAHTIDGQIFAIFSMVMAAAEVAVALALVLNIYRSIGSINVDDADVLKG